MRSDAPGRADEDQHPRRAGLKIYVEISYQRLATLGFTGHEMLAARANQNNVTPAGLVETAGPRVYLRLDRAIDGLATPNGCSGSKLVS